MTHSQSRTTNAGRRLIPLLLALAVVAACGQKSGVAGSDASDAQSRDSPRPRPPTPRRRTDTQPPSTEAGDSTPPADTTDSTEPSTEPTAAPEETAPPAEEGPYEPGGDDTAGVADNEIVIGIHAPVTGASPIPQTSFDVGKDIYWKFLAETAPDTLFGRTRAGRLP